MGSELFINSVLELPVVLLTDTERLMYTFLQNELDQRVDIGLETD